MNQGMAAEQMLKPMKALRKDILKLIQIYIETEDNFEIFNQNFLPTFQSMVRRSLLCHIGVPLATTNKGSDGLAACIVQLWRTPPS